MKKRLSFLLLLLLMLGGCDGSRLLQEIPRDFSLMGSEPVRGKEDTEEERDTEEPEADAASGYTEESLFLYDGAYEYAAQYLNEAELAWYRDIRQTLGSFGKDVRLDGAALEAGCDEEDIDRIFQCVLGDHPELFFVEGYSYTKYSRGDEITAVTFSGTYSIDRETARERREEIEAAAAQILSGIEEDSDQYTKVKYVYDTIISRTDYDPAAPDNQNIYSVFVGGRSVCQGYAKAVQYLLNRLGVECTLVLGTVETDGEEGQSPAQEGHAWNLVRIDGAYYYVDATWGDASYSRQDGVQTKELDIPEINYDYLNVTTAELFRTHTLGGSVPMPQCIATQANYYAKEGALFTSYDKEQLQRLFDRAKTENRDNITVKCADRECYEKVLEELVEKHEIFRYMGEAEAAVAYARNDNQMSVTFWVTNE